MSLVLLTVFASAFHGAFAFQTTSNGCVTCAPPPDSTATTCVALFGDLIIAAGGSNTNINTAEGNGFCCGQSSTSCSSFASDIGLDNIAETCDAACVSIFSSSTSSPPPAPKGSPPPPKGTSATPPTPGGSSTAWSNTDFESFCSTYFFVMNNTDLDTSSTVLSILASASKNVIAGPTQCCGWCLATEACYGWVYNNVTTPANCFLKSGSSLNPPTTASTSAVQSGYLRTLGKHAPSLSTYALNQ